MLKRFALCMPLYKGSVDHVEKAINSILDQGDYPNWKLCICLDGNGMEEEKKVVDGKEVIEYPHKEWVLKAEEIIKKYTDERISYTKIPHKGAPATRNEAARELLKDPEVAYLSFFSSDFIMKPGCLFEWNDEFEKHPDCGFVYGGYDLTYEGNSTGQWLASNPFDERQLEVANYIDGAFPVRREHYVEWDESIKSLQDWDWWLSIVKKGVKGHFTNTRPYMAEVPKPKGLSYDSESNWLERVSTIKIKHNIPDRKICVTSLGAPFHAQRIAKILDADFSGMPSYKPHKYRLIYLLGYFAMNPDHAKVFAGSGLNEGVVKAIHWIGTDVYILNGFQHNQLAMLNNTIINKHIDYNLSEYEYTQKELQSLGIKCKYQEGIPIVPFPIEEIEPVPLPDKFTVAIYYPATEDAEWKYQLFLMRDLIAALPDIDFKLFGGHKGSENANIEYMGWVNTVKDVIPKSSVLVRITQHDGLPVSALEFLMSGRQVITNTPMPYVEWLTTMSPENNSMCGITKDNYVDTLENLITRIRRLQKGYGSLKYNWDEIQGFYRNWCGVETFKKNINLMLERKPIITEAPCRKYYREGGIYNG